MTPPPSPLLPLHPHCPAKLKSEAGRRNRRGKLLKRETSTFPHSYKYKQYLLSPLLLDIPTHFVSLSFLLCSQQKKKPKTHVHKKRIRARPEQTQRQKESVGEAQVADKPKEYNAKGTYMYPNRNCKGLLRCFTNGQQLGNHRKRKSKTLSQVSHFHFSFSLVTSLPLFFFLALLHSLHFPFLSSFSFFCLLLYITVLSS